MGGARRVLEGVLGAGDTEAGESCQKWLWIISLIGRGQKKAKL